MAEIEKTCENCEYEHEDLEGTHCRHCIHNAEEHFAPKTERVKVIDRFKELAIKWNNESSKKVPYEFIQWVAELLKEGGK